MNILLLVEQPGPAEGLLTSNLRAEGHRVYVYDVRGSWISGEADVPTWLKGYRLRYSGLAADYFRDFVQRREIGKVITSGIVSAAFAAQNISMPFIPLVFRGDLDFSSAKLELNDAFFKANQGVSRFLLEDEWEMDKANSKGSSVPHLLMPQPVASTGSVLKRDHAAHHVALLHPAKMPASRIDAMTANFAAGLPDVAVTPVEIESLYRTVDLGRGRDLYGLAATRLAAYSHVVLLGTSRHHSSVLSLLAQDWDRVAVEETIGGGNLARAVGFGNVGRGLRLVEVVQGLLQDGKEQQAGESTAAGQSLASGAQKINTLEAFEKAMRKVVPPSYEELQAFSAEGPLNIYFSVAPLQDVTNGARPQRIRNMAEAFDVHQPAVRIFSAGNGFNRRTKYVLKAIKQGRKAGIFYGENSTAPIASDQVIEGLGQFLADFQAHGGKSAWFVRDLHWLEKVEGYLDDEQAREETIRRGIKELETVARRADVVYAPNAESGDGFNSLLRRGGHDEFEWHALPPGVAFANVSTPAAFAQNTGLTLLYAGGTNSVYGMSTYLEAAKEQPKEGVYFDFVCREAEVDDLIEALRSAGLEDDPRVRIQHVELENYVPQTPTTVGTVLLDSEYAKFSFPYKTVSMIERGFPILTYQDMAIADFVREVGVGVVVERTAASISAGINQIRDHIHEFGFDSARRANSWESRVATVEQDLDASNALPV
ncbi:hypothetical protein ACXA45_06835 [Neomicrococcus lactis]